LNKGTKFGTDLESQPLGEIREDIPEALRSNGMNSLPTKQKTNKKLILGSGLLLTVLTIIIAIFFYRPTVSSQSNTLSNADTSNSDDNIEINNSEGNNDLLGHLSYEEAPPSELKNITADGRLKLREAAANKFIEMQNAARRDGIILTPISAFRSKEEQNKLFFEIKEQRGQIVTQRAEVSAPPGYSEHHTGYAIDIGDGNVPATNLNTDFENTQAFQWLAQNASNYSFELSFPENNPQGVIYEPWHWRFVGDLHSLETFYKAKNLSNN
jgi:zinc D-Ala-D-Ala carboxypeptidase